MEKWNIITNQRDTVCKGLDTRRDVKCLGNCERFTGTGMSGDSVKTVKDEEKVNWTTL